MRYSDVLSIAAPEVLRLYTGAATGEIPLIDSQLGNFDFGVAYTTPFVNAFTQGKEDKPFTIEVWVDTGTVRIGHSSNGLTISPTSILLQLPSGTYTASLFEEKTKHVVFTYSPESIAVYVNGEAVISEAPTTVTFMNETTVGIYKISTSARYDGLALYRRYMRPEEVLEHYQSGRQFDAFEMEERFGVWQWQPQDNYVEHVKVAFDSPESWQTGVNDNLIATDTLNSTVENGVIFAGEWSVSIPLDIYTNIYAIKIEWEGSSALTLSYTLDGVTTPISEPDTFEPYLTDVPPAGSSLELNVVFPAGTECELSFINVVIYISQTTFMFNDRTVTLTDVELPSEIKQPNDFHKFAGAKVNGTIQFSASSTAVKEIYGFIKPGSGTVLTIGTVSLSSALAVTGAATIATSTAVNGWRWFKLTLTTPSTAAITIDNCTLLSIAVSSIQNTTLTMNNLFANPILSASEANIIVVDDNDPRAYSNNWEITGVGG